MSGRTATRRAKPARRSPARRTPATPPRPSDVGHTLRVLVDATDNDGTGSAASAASSAVLSASSSLGALPGTGPSTGTSTRRADVANGTGASETAVLHLGVPRSISRSFAQRAFKLTGRLTDSQGQPIAGASLDVLQQTAGSNTTGLIEHARTSSSGAFAVAVRGGSLAAHRGRLPRVLRRCRLRGAGNDPRDGRRRGEARRQPPPNELHGDDHPLRQGARADPGAGHDRRAARALPGALGALPNPANQRARILPGRLSVRGRSRTIPVSGGSPRGPGRLPVRQRIQPVVDVATS